MYLANFFRVKSACFSIFYENLTVFEASAEIDENWEFKNENTFKINNQGSVFSYIFRFSSFQTKNGF
jgi:hypothetical protein